MSDKIKLLQFRNIRLVPYAANTVLTVGDDVTPEQAKMLIQSGAAERIGRKGKKAVQK